MIVPATAENIARAASARGRRARRVSDRDRLRAGRERARRGGGRTPVRCERQARRASGDRSSRRRRCAAALGEDGPGRRQSAGQRLLARTADDDPAARRWRPRCGDRRTGERGLARAGAADRACAAWRTRRPRLRRHRRALGEPLRTDQRNDRRHVAEEFGDAIALILDGGPSHHGIESTIVDFSSGDPVVLRPGSITSGELARVLGAAPRSAGAGATRASGTLASHYAPRTPAKLLPRNELLAAIAGLGGSNAHISVLAHSVAQPPEFEGAWFDAPGESAGYAQQLYANLRALDAREADEIWIEAPPDGPDWVAIGDRLSLSDAPRLVACAVQPCNQAAHPLRAPTASARPGAATSADRPLLLQPRSTRRRSADSRRRIRRDGVRCRRRVPVRIPMT